MKSKHLWQASALLHGVIVIGCPLLITWALGPLMPPYLGFVTNHFLTPLGITRLPDTIEYPITCGILTSPVVAAYVAFLFLINRSSMNRKPVKQKDQLRALAAAKESLASSLAFLDGIQAEIQSSSRRFEELSALVASLEATSKEKSSKLRQKLDAIAYTDKRTEALKMLASFVLGVIASLVAAAIWSSISR